MTANGGRQTCAESRNWKAGYCSGSEADAWDDELEVMTEMHAVRRITQNLLVPELCQMVWDVALL